MTIISDEDLLVTYFEPNFLKSAEHILFIYVKMWNAKNSTHLNVKHGIHTYILTWSQK